MEILKLYPPAKPYVCTQAWGVYNPAYLQFGFSKHNGEDFRIGADKLTHCPVKSEVLEAAYNQYKGWFVRLRTVDQWIVNGEACYVEMIFMHHEKVLCKTGDILDIGDVMGVPDNTGFSTGPHTHGYYARVGGPSKNQLLDTNKDADYTFDPHPYWQKVAAQDYYTVIGYLQRLIPLLGSILKAKQN